MATSNTAAQFRLDLMDALETEVEDVVSRRDAEDRSGGA